MQLSASVLIAAVVKIENASLPSYSARGGTPRRWLGDERARERESAIDGFGKWSKWNGGDGRIKQCKAERNPGTKPENNEIKRYIDFPVRPAVEIRIFRHFPKRASICTPLSISLFIFLSVARSARSLAITIFSLSRRTNTTFHVARYYVAALVPAALCNSRNKNPSFVGEGATSQNLISPRWPRRIYNCARYAVTLN